MASLIWCCAKTRNTCDGFHYAGWLCKTMPGAATTYNFWQWKVTHPIHKDNLAVVAINLLYNIIYIYIYILCIRFEEDYYYNNLWQGLHGRSIAVVFVDANTVKGTERSNSAHLQTSWFLKYFLKKGEGFTLLPIAPSFYKQGLYSLCICSQLSEIATVDTILSSDNA